ncbi:xanthine dehydrogenase accessory protein XdhC [Aureimonas jatrophae]|uniref:Molybdenum cofactor sulfurylase n=1 Tax=Aureimonas jatrophae TaxID=1166073 RepID=A0A1H0HMY0_9HYPH|nr:xanthine dehydrogenase accessory protein XdhC [Aureimonas jatrophae]MBB3950675.1 xanthine dehydrogenase accessory factor [Aureimonas jatrophae]SDO20470.1 molybdenum cofactor sulfurylase [Aureimonas jatrophae]
MSEPDVARALASGEPACLVEVERARGSTPREEGAAMLVTATSVEGTVGGGALEMEAIIEARRLLAAGEDTSRLAVPLGPAIGQCCGGHVTLRLCRLTESVAAEREQRLAAEREQDPAVLVFGAGHTGQALARALQPLPLRLLVVDTRADHLARLPDGVERRLTVLPEETIEAAEPGSAFVVMTHDHGLDFLLAAAALARGDAAYVGMIGSATKRRTFERRLAEEGRAGDAEKLTLPIGGAALRDKRPSVIAALAAAEILVALARSRENRCTGFAPAQNGCNNVSDRSTAALHAATS